MEISARSIVDQRGEQVADRRRRRSAPPRARSRCACCARAISSAPVTTRRTVRTLRHFSASASSRQAAGTSGNVSRCTEPSADGIARQPGLLGGERQHRREPGDGGAEQLVDHRQAGLARRPTRSDRSRARPCGCRSRRPRGRRHEGVERGEDALVVEIGIGLAHLRVELGEPVQHQPLELGHARPSATRSSSRKCASEPSIQRMVLRSLR